MPGPTFSAGDFDYIDKLNQLSSGLLTVSTQNSNFAAAAGNWYVLTATGLTVTLPATASAGHRIRFCSGSSAVTSVTLNRNGLNIDSVASNVTLTGSDTIINVELLYVNSTIGWRIVRNATNVGAFVEVKSGTFTAVKGFEYVIKTGSFTATLPASPVAGDTVRFMAGDFNVSTLTLGRNSQPIDSAASDYILVCFNFDVTAVYVDGTIGWKLVFNHRNQLRSPAISSNTLSLDFERGRTNTFAVSLNANITTLNLNNPPASGDPWGFELWFTADGTLRSITWPAAVKWVTVPGMSSTNGKIDRIYLETKDGGTSWYPSIIAQGQ